MLLKKTTKVLYLLMGSRQPTENRLLSVSGLAHPVVRLIGPRLLTLLRRLYTLRNLESPFCTHTRRLAHYT